MKHIKKPLKIVTAFLILLTALSSVLCANASEAYSGYNYDSWGNSHRTPNGYTVEKTLCDFGDNLTLNEPTDFCFFDDKLYILDNGNNRVVVLNEKYELYKSIEGFKFKNANGIFVSEKNKIFICDTDNNRVLVVNENGETINTLERPTDGSFPEDLMFLPKKVVVDELDNTYVLSNGFFYGAVVYDKNGIFKGFYGANPVELTAGQMIDLMWRKLLSRTQVNYMKKYVPIEYSSMDIDDSGFIYTCTKNTDTSMEELKELNALGKNILGRSSNYDPLNKSDYGDKEKLVVNWQTIDTQFGDISVSDKGFINALDEMRGRVFQYDKDSNLLTIFGGIGSQNGMFKKPVAVESVGEQVLVLDKEKSSITFFSPTKYGALLHKATISNNSDTFDDDTSIWNEILQIDGNSEIAYRGLGRTYLKTGHYEKAMDCFKLGQDRAGYSESLQLQRTIVTRKWFPVMAVLVILIVVLLLCRKRIKNAVNKKLKRTVDENKFSLFEIFSHPINFYEKLFDNKSKRPLIISFVVIISFVFAKAIERQKTGFVFNQNNLDEFNIFLIIAQTAGIVALWCLSDKVVSSLRFGQGTFRKIWMGTTFAMLPYIISTFITTFLSNFMGYEEGSILKLITAIAVLYSVYLLFQAVRIMQQYTVVQAITSFVFNLVVAIVLLFMAVLIASLGKQLITFFRTIVSEIMYRI